MPAYILHCPLRRADVAIVTKYTPIPIEFATSLQRRRHGSPVSQDRLTYISLYRLFIFWCEHSEHSSVRRRTPSGSNPPVERTGSQQVD